MVFGLGGVRMPLKDEIEMLNMSISITKQKIPSCNNKRERLLLQDRLACLKAELRLAVKERQKKESENPV